MNIDRGRAAADVGGSLVDCDVETGAWMLEFVDIVCSGCTARASACKIVSYELTVLGCTLTHRL